MKFTIINFLIINSILFSLNSFAMNLEKISLASDTLKLILHHVITEQNNNNSLIEGSNHLCSQLNAAKNELHNIACVNRFFRKITVDFLQKYTIRYKEEHQKANITMYKIFDFLELQYKFISYTQQFQNDLINYFNKQKDLIDPNYAYKKNDIVEYINTLSMTWVEQLPSEIVLFYLRYSDRDIIEQFINEEKEMSYLPFFISCYDAINKIHYHDICSKMQLSLRELFVLKKYIFLQERIRDLCTEHTPARIDDLLRVGVLFCPVLKLFVEQNCQPYPLLMEDNELLPGKIINQSTSESYRTKKTISPSSLSYQYLNKNIDFEKFINRIFEKISASEKK